MHTSTILSSVNTKDQPTGLHRNELRIESMADIELAHKMQLGTLITKSKTVCVFAIIDAMTYVRVDVF